MWGLNPRHLYLGRVLKGNNTKKQHAKKQQLKKQYAKKHRQKSNISKKQQNFIKADIYIYMQLDDRKSTHWQKSNIFENVIV